MTDSFVAEPTLAVIVPSCDMQRYTNLGKVIDSLLHQSRKASEIIIVANESKELAERLLIDFGHYDTLKIIAKDEALGAAQARNVGVKASSSDIVAFTDDDSIPDIKWIEKLVEIYRNSDVIAVGGKVMPVWLSDKPSFLPEELYWLVGATHEKIFKDSIASVRNTFGPNMSFKRDILESVGYFDEQFGYKGANNSQSLIGGEEQELGLRIMHRYGKGSIYHPEAIVYHYIPESKTKVKMLIKRAFYFGVAKRLIMRKDPYKNNMDAERSYLEQVMSKFIPGHIQDIFCGPAHLASFKKLVFLIIVIGVIGAGFISSYVFAK